MLLEEDADRLHAVHRTCAVAGRVARIAKKTCNIGDFSSEPSGTRTRDPVIKSHMLYQPELTAHRGEQQMIAGMHRLWKARGIRLSKNQLRADPPENRSIDFRFRYITGAGATHRCWLLKSQPGNAATRLGTGLPYTVKKASWSNPATMSNTTR